MGKETSNPDNEPACSEAADYLSLAKFRARVLEGQRASRSEPVVRELVAALRGLARTPRPCFCEHGIGNPMFRGCTESCQRAREAVANGELLLQALWPSTEPGTPNGEGT